jgi:hypothetical protein
MQWSFWITPHEQDNLSPMFTFIINYANTLNLLSLSSLKTKEVGPVSWTKYNLYYLATGIISSTIGVGLLRQGTNLDILQSNSS